jgi:hypothetical protein
MHQRKTHPFVARLFLHLLGVAIRRREEETLPHHRAPLAALLVLAGALAGCTGGTHVPSPSPSVASSSASPTPTLSEGQRAANDTVIKYRALVDQLRQQYKPDSTLLLAFARDAAYDKWRRVLQDDFVNGYHQTGVAALAVESIDPGSGPRQWLVSGCLDVTRLDVVDKSGKTTLEHPGGINHVAYTVDQDPSTSTWYVTSETFDGGTC